MKEELEKIYRLYAEDVYRYALSICADRQLAQDVLQDTMLKALTEFGKFRGECSVKTWLCAIAKNLCLSRLSRSERRDLPLEEALSASSEDPYERIFDSDQALQIHKALHRLEEPYREIFSLRVLGQLKFAQIAQIFGRTENWARVTFYRAKEKLIAMMKEEKL
ncbi:MAG: sigma-70 family RNA polymerase sigma factor [Ruminococcus sp.]|nr:sigma-70 family RNA polymerase sigma factor [Ruminococcus sp.]